MNSQRAHLRILDSKDWVWIFVYAIILLLDIFFIHQDLDSYRAFSKPSLMATLLIVLWNTANYKHKYAFRLHFLALFLSWVGDIILLTDLFLTGLIAFLWAHISYMFLMANIGIKLKGFHFWIRAILTLLIGVVVGYYIGHFHADFQWPILIYTVVILMMLQFSSLVRPYSGLIIGGAIFFVISDFLLAYGRFIPPLDWHILATWKPELVMLTYGIAQLLLLLGFRAAGRRYLFSKFS